MLSTIRTVLASAFLLSLVACGEEPPAPAGRSSASDDRPAGRERPTIEIHAPSPPSVIVEAD